MQSNQTSSQLNKLEASLLTEYDQVKTEGLALDLTRGKPGTEQLTLSNGLDGILSGNYQTAEGTDTRNYGGIDGIPALKKLGATLLGVDESNVLVGGNSSLTLMYQLVQFAYFLGVNNKAEDAWQKEGSIKFICPVPGYDRHFSICEQFGIEMISVPLSNTGPDMDKVEALVKADPLIKGIWCVPKYSNPTGDTYSDDTVDRLAKLANIAGANFRVIWDNAYAVHDLTDTPAMLSPIAERCKVHGTQDSVLQFASTSKITFPGAGIAFLATSENNLNVIKSQLGINTIGPDKINQQRHALFFQNEKVLRDHMVKHKNIIKPKFDIVLEKLEVAFSDSDEIKWTKPQGGYFISVDLKPGLAKKVVSLAANVGVKLTPAGATFPYGKDPLDSNIRLAPTFPSAEEVGKTIDIFILCVKLAVVQQKLRD